MKNILWLTPGFAANEKDSRCIPPMQLLAKALQASGQVQLHIIALHYPYLKEPYKWHGISVYPCYQSGKFGRLQIWRRAFRYVRQIRREHQIDMLHSFWLTDAALLGHWLSRLYRLPHWVTLMGQDARRSNQYLRFFPIPKMNTITLSPFHDDQFFSTTGHRATKLIPWGIPPVEQSSPQEKRTIDLLGVGNLIPLKDYATFIRLVVLWKKQQPDIRAVLVGDGPERARLEQLARELGVSEQIAFKGYLPRAEVLALMQQSKILLHPSTYESFGLVFLEALACGMQIVSRSVGIAAKASYWHLGEEEPGLYLGLEQAILSYKQPEVRLPFSLFDNVRSYIDLYENN